MPVMDGISACRLLRQRIPGDLLPVIFLTAKTDPGAVQKGFEAGGTDFVTKPLNRQSVISRTICQGLASRRARARYFDTIPMAVSILTQDPFWKMRPASGEREMFVVSMHVPSPDNNNKNDNKNTASTTAQSKGGNLGLLQQIVLW